MQILYYITLVNLLDYACYFSSLGKLIFRQIAERKPNLKPQKSEIILHKTSVCPTCELARYARSAERCPAL
eukprot:scaffold1220_cov259-Pinguiococcus_pyrenoidosus.AAC.13